MAFRFPRSVERAVARRFLALPPRILRRIVGPARRSPDGLELDLQLQSLLWLIDTLKVPPLAGGDVEAARRGLDRSAPTLDVSPEPGVAAYDRTVEGAEGSLRARVYVPRGSGGASPGLVYFHGGGWVIGSIESHDRVCRAIAGRARAVVISVDYRLAPEHPFPAGVDDCWAALQWVAEHAAELGGDPKRIAVAGDSAGGNLAAVIAQRARDEGGPTLAFQLLWYPSITADLSLPSFTENADAPILDGDVIDAFLHWYIPDIDITDAKALPTFIAPSNAEDFAGLAPAFIGSAEHDPLRDDAALYAGLLNDAGVPAELSNESTLVHGYVSFALIVPAAAEATNRGLAALKSALH
jgi:acetyl esterase/lipase